MADTTQVTVINGVTTPQVTVSQLESSQTSGTHVGTFTADYSTMYGGCVVSFRRTQPIIADAALYAALNAASAPVTWAD
jgi:hypothetical protein